MEGQKGRIGWNHLLSLSATDVIERKEFLLLFFHQCLLLLKAVNEQSVCVRNKRKEEGGVVSLSLSLSLIVVHTTVRSNNRFAAESLRERAVLYYTPFLGGSKPLSPPLKVVKREELLLLSCCCPK